MALREGADPSLTPSPLESAPFGAGEDERDSNDQ